MTIGAAGQASGTQAANGGDGGTSSFGSHCSATGGEGGRVVQVIKLKHFLVLVQTVI